MQAEEIKKLKTELHEKADTLRDQLRKVADENPLIKDEFDVRVEDLGSSMEDASQELGEFDRRKALVNKLEKELKDVEYALEKIEQGSYGKCENCSTEIIAERMRARPVATLCMSCAQRSGK
jgi:RNA polymerase-binding transcription factor DksA